MVTALRRYGLVAFAFAFAACTPAETGHYGPATWALDPDAEITGETTEFTAWVTERACASGRSSEDRIGGPDIQLSDDAVILSFGVVPLPGAQDCQGNPPTAVTVPPLIMSIIVQAANAAAGANRVLVKASVAVVPADNALPALKPNQPNQSRPAPSIVNGTLCGRIAWRP